MKAADIRALQRVNVARKRVAAESAGLEKPQRVDPLLVDATVGPIGEYRARRRAELQGEISQGVSEFLLGARCKMIDAARRGVASTLEYQFPCLGYFTRRYSRAVLGPKRGEIVRDETTLREEFTLRGLAENLASIDGYAKFEKALLDAGFDLNLWRRRRTIAASVRASGSSLETIPIWEDQGEITYVFTISAWRTTPTGLQEWLHRKLDPESDLDWIRLPMRRRM